MIKTIFISGPMSGYANFNYDAFNDAAEVLRGAGYTVHNPAEFFDGDQTLSWHDYMRRDVEVILSDTDAIVALEGWEDSKGANVEITVARALGLPVWDITNFAPVVNTPKDPTAQVPDHPDNPETEQMCYTEPDLDDAFAFGVHSTAGYSYNMNGYTSGSGGSYWFVPIQRESPEAVAEDSVVEETILEEAARVVDGPRQDIYDHPADNFTRIAEMWSTFLGTEVTPEQHAVCMILVKVARLMKTPNHRDTLVDIAGYARTIEKLMVERERRQGIFG